MSPAKGQALYEALTGASAVTDLVGTRIYRNHINESTTAPHLLIIAVNAEIPASHNEATNEQEDTIQIACFATTFETASAIRAAVRATLDNQPLSTGDNPTTTDEREDYEQAARLHRCDIDLTL